MVVQALASVITRGGGGRLKRLNLCDHPAFVAFAEEQHILLLIEGHNTDLYPHECTCGVCVIIIPRHVGNSAPLGWTEGEKDGRTVIKAIKYPNVDLL